MFEQLAALLSFDPVLIGAFAGLSMMVVQMLKGISPWIDEHAMVLNMALSAFFATMIIMEFERVLGISILTFLIMSSASGVYSAGKKKTVIDFSDESQ